MTVEIWLDPARGCVFTQNMRYITITSWKHKITNMFWLKSPANFGNNQKSPKRLVPTFDIIFYFIPNKTFLFFLVGVLTLRTNSRIWQFLLKSSLTTWQLKTNCMLDLKMLVQALYFPKSMFGLYNLSVDGWVHLRF